MRYRVTQKGQSTHLAWRGFCVVHLELDAGSEQALRDLLEHARLDAARARLCGAGPVGVVHAHGRGRGRAEEDELGLDPD